jgi:hypothetical protein
VLRALWVWGCELLAAESWWLVVVVVVMAMPCNAIPRRAEGPPGVGVVGSWEISQAKAKRRKNIGSFSSK